MVKRAETTRATVRTSVRHTSHNTCWTCAVGVQPVCTRQRAPTSRARDYHGTVCAPKQYCSIRDADVNASALPCSQPWLLRPQDITGAVAAEAKVTTSIAATATLPRPQAGPALIARDRRTLFACVRVRQATENALARRLPFSCDHSATGARRVSHVMNSRREGQYKGCCTSRDIA